MSAILIADSKATQQFRTRSQEKCHVSGMRIYFGKNFVTVEREYEILINRICKK